MSATQTSALRLHRLEIENFLRVEALQVEADGHHIVLSGPNASGKTSSVDAIWITLGGKAPKEPVRKGAERASVRLDLGEYVVERVWTEKASRLVVTAADGSKVARPQQLLDGLLGRFALDPVSFLQRRPQDQVDDVLQLAGIAPPVGEVMTVTGEAHDPRPGESASNYLERLSADEVGLYFVRRREAHRVLDQKRAALEEHRRTLEALGGTIKPDEPEASASALLAQVEQLQQKADERRAVQAEAERARQDHLDAVNRLGGIVADQERVQAEIKRLTAQSAELLARISKGRSVVAELEHERAACDEAAAALPDPAPQIAALRQQVRTVEQTNAAQGKRRLAAEQLLRLAREGEQALGDHRTLDNALTALRTLRAHLLDGFDLGVPGLAVGLGELRLNDVPLRQASQAEQIRVACAVAMRQQPRLRLLRVDDGEHLDKKSRELLFQIADEMDFQVIFTAVADTDRLRVEIIDKEAV